MSVCFFFAEPVPTEIYTVCHTLPLHDALPIWLLETPLHTGHLRSMLALSEMGAIIAPPVPGFYARPESIDEMVDHTLGRVLDRSEERRVGKECVSTCRSRWARADEKKKIQRYERQYTPYHRHDQLLKTRGTCEKQR